MSRYDFTSHRLHVVADLTEGAEIAPDAAQANYLRNVLRLGDGATILVFNGRDGEWRAAVKTPTRKTTALIVGERTRPQDALPDLHYLFAPLKHARLDYMVQKAVEMGASLLQPVMTRRSQAERINLDRMRANVIEAAEQCGILSIADVAPPLRFEAMIAAYKAERPLVFCDEDADGDPLVALRSAGLRKGSPLAVLIGPEGGFAPEERAALLALPAIIRLSLGPRILRADTAAVAALSLVQTALGDW